MRLSAFRRRLVSALTWRTGLGLAILVVFVVCAVGAPLIAPYDPAERTDAGILGGPSWASLLGTDDLARDTLSRLIYGARVSLQAGGLAVGIALIIGLPVGLIAGFRRGWIDAVLMRAADGLLAFPGLVLAIGVTSVLGPSVTNAMLAVGVLFSPAIARLMRGQVLAVRESLFVEVARSYGASTWRIMTRHVLANSIQPVLVQASTMFGLALIAEAGLSFLGLGVQPPAPSWGGMLSRSYAYMHTAAFQAIVPGIAIVLAVFAFNAVGDLIQDLLDPTRQQSREPERAASPVVDATSTVPPAAPLIP